MTIFEQIKTPYEFKNNVTTFKDNTTGAIWYDVPFAYDPYWNKKG